MNKPSAATESSVRTRRLFRLTLLSGAVALALAACGGGDDTTPAPAPVPAPVPQSTLEQVKAFLAAYEQRFAVAVPITPEARYDGFDSCYVNNGETVTNGTATWSSDSAAAADGLQHLVGHKYVNVRILNERRTANADGSSRHEIDVAFDILFKDGTQTIARADEAPQTLIAGSSSGTADCTIPTSNSDLRWFGNRRIIDVSVQPRNVKWTNYMLVNGNPLAPIEQLRREIRFNVIDPDRRSTYVVITGPGPQVGGQPFSLKFLSPRIMRDAPEMQNKAGNANWSDLDAFNGCLVTGGDWGSAATADCTARGASGRDWSMTASAPFNSTYLTAQDAAFDAWGFSTSADYKFAVYADDGWKTLNGHLGKTPIATYTAKLPRVPYAFEQMVKSPSAYPQITSSSLTSAQLAEAFVGNGATSKFQWSAAMEPSGGRPVALAAIYAYRHGSSIGTSGAFPRVRATTLAIPSGDATSLDLVFQGKPPGASATSYAELGWQYTDRNGGWLVAASRYTAHAPAPTPTEGAKQAWAASRVFLPNTSQATTIESLKQAPKSPVAVFLHGCKGLGTGYDDVGRALAAQGYLVVMPESLARTDRAGRFTCSSDNYQPGTGNLDIYSKRVEEAEYAASITRQQPWFDGQHLLIVGHSEGALTVARKYYPGTTAAIVSGLWCNTFEVNSYIPTLTVNHDKDPWYVNLPQYPDGSRCSIKPGVPGSKDVLLPGPYHGIFESAASRAAVLEYSAAHLRN